MDIVSIIHRALMSNEVLAVIIAAILSAIGWVAVRIYVGQGKVGWSVSHQHAFNLHNLTPPTVAYTKEIWVQNIGRSIAEEVEVILAFKPDYYDLWPQLHFAELVNPDKSVVIKIDTLNRREHVTISMMQATRDLPFVTNVRWRGGKGKEVLMAPRQIFPRWVNVSAGMFAVIGFFATWYFLFRLILR